MCVLITWTEWAIQLHLIPSLPTYTEYSQSQLLSIHNCTSLNRKQINIFFRATRGRNSTCPLCLSMGIVTVSEPEKKRKKRHCALQLWSFDTPWTEKREEGIPSPSWRVSCGPIWPTASAPKSSVYGRDFRKKERRKNYIHGCSVLAALR